MKSKIFMYLFFFSLLLVLFMYMNQKSIYEVQEQRINALTTAVEKQQEQVSVLNESIADLSYFTLQGNENAMTYIESLGLESETVETQVREAVLEKNLEKGGNPLIDYEGYGEFRINNMRFLNHRWIQAEFSDGKVWGELIIEYFYNETLELELTPIASVLYPTR